MRIDLHSNTRRISKKRLVLWLVKKYIGMIPGPMLYMSYDKDLPGKHLDNFKRRRASKTAAFANEEFELFSAFVSRLNSCGF